MLWYVTHFRTFEVSIVHSPLLLLFFFRQGWGAGFDNIFLHNWRSYGEDNPGTMSRNWFSYRCIFLSTGVGCFYGCGILTTRRTFGLVYICTVLVPRRAGFVLWSEMVYKSVLFRPKGRFTNAILWHFLSRFFFIQGLLRSRCSSKSHVQTSSDSRAIPRGFRTCLKFDIILQDLLSVNVQMFWNRSLSREKLNSSVTNVSSNRNPKSRL